MDAQSTSERQRLSLEALALDPGCVDALCVQACLGGNLDVAAQKVMDLATKAEAMLGEDFIEEHKGRLWEQESARPYLRTRLCLADLLARSGRFRLALPHLEALLRFAPSDPMKVRYHLARCYACIGKTELLNRLLSSTVDVGPVWTWLKILERMKTQKQDDALALLQHARVRNSHVEDYLTAVELPPKTFSTDPLPGSCDEAAASLRFLELPWRSDRQAMYWLFTEGKRR